MAWLRADMAQDVADMATTFEQMFKEMDIPHHIALILDDKNGLKATDPTSRPPTACEVLEWFALRLRLRVHQHRVYSLSHPGCKLKGIYSFFQTNRTIATLWRV